MIQFISLLSLFWKNKSKLMRSRCCVCECVCVCARPCIPPSVVARQRLGKRLLMVARQHLGKKTSIVARQRFGKNPLIVARQRLGKNFPNFARQRLGRNVTAVTNTHATIEELLDASFSCGPCRIKESRTELLL
jgi:hypothetical protein